MIITLCLNSREIEECSPDSYELFERCPGSGWVGAFKRLCKEREIGILTGEIALKGILDGNLNPEILTTICEENSTSASMLRGAGAQSGVVLCLESPIYTPEFYKWAPALRAMYKKRSLVFGSDTVHFPSFGDWDLVDPKPWASRKFCGWVVSNKFIPTSDRFSLHKYRQDVINHFLSKGMELAGHGWGFAPVVKNKREWLNQFKFTFCIENYETPGYVTEKLIHAIIAGCIPVYVGAFDVGNLVPKELYLAPERRMTMETVEFMMNDLGADKANAMIKAGQDWLRAEGHKFHYDSFAKQVFEMLPNSP